MARISRQASGAPRLEPRAAGDREHRVSAGGREGGAKQYDEARKLWTEFLAKYPLDGRNPSIMFQFGQMNFSQEKWDEAIADWRRLVSKYPGTERSLAGAVHDCRARWKRSSASSTRRSKEYKKVNWGQLHQQATVAVEAADEQEHGDRHRARLPQRTKRRRSSSPAATSNRSPCGRTRSTGNLLPQDARTSRGVEGLDISLIDPDKTFEFKVPKYAEYQQLESEIEVPLSPKPGRTARN